MPVLDISNAIAFAPDGKAVAYSVVENGVGNIWAQPLDGQVRPNPIVPVFT